MEEIRRQVLREEFRDSVRKTAVLEKAIAKAKAAVEVEETVLARKKKVLEIAQRDYIEVLEQRQEILRRLQETT